MVESGERRARVVPGHAGVVLHEVGGVAAGLPARTLAVAGNEAGRDERVLAARRRGDRAEGLADGVDARIPAVGHGHDEGFCGLDDVAHGAARDAAQGGVGKRPLDADGAGFLGGEEDARAGAPPVDALGGGPVGQQALAVRGRGPDDRTAVAAGDDEQALAHGGRAVVAGAELAPLDGVAQVAELGGPAAEGVALAFPVGKAVVAEGTPAPEFLHVLQADHGGAHAPGPEQDDPGEVADVAFERTRPLGLGKMFAIGTEPGERDRASAGGLDRVDLPDVALEVAGAGMVGLVHGDRFGVVVDRDVEASCGALESERGAAASGEVVDDEAGDGGARGHGRCLRAVGFRGEAGGAAGCQSSPFCWKLK